MKHQIGLSPVWTSCSVRPRLAGRRPTGSQNWSRGFVSGFESGPLSKLNTCGFNFPFFLAFFSTPPPPPLRGNKKNSLPCRQRDTVPFAKENLSFQSPGEQWVPKFPLHPPVEGGGTQTGSPPDLEVSAQVSIVLGQSPGIQHISPHILGGCGDRRTTGEAFLKVLGCRNGWSINAQ